MRIVIICKSFNRNNIRKQPWNYLFEISKSLVRTGHDMTIITDVIDESKRIQMENIKQVLVERITGPLGEETNELLEAIDDENPDIIIMLFGLTSCLRMGFRIKQPTVGVFTSPRYSIKELLNNIGIRDLICQRKYTSIHLLGSLIPRTIIRKWLSRLSAIITLSNWSSEKLMEFGIAPDKIFVIPPGFDKTFFKRSDLDSIGIFKRGNDLENSPIILYFTAPLTLRGTDTLIKAFSKVLSSTPSKLLCLFRHDDSDSILHEEEIIRLIDEYGVSDSVTIVSKCLSPEEIRGFLAASDIIVLPFKIIISDFPISILEAEASGKTVISTSVGSIPEILEGGGIIVPPNDPARLASSIISLVRDERMKEKLENNARKKMEEYPNWDEIGKMLSDLISKVNIQPIEIQD